MKIGIHPDLIGDESYSKKWAKSISKMGEDFEFINLLNKDNFDKIEKYDGIMWRWAHNPNEKQSAKQILFSIEKTLNIPVFPNISTSWHFDDKIAQYYLLSAINAPMPDTMIFWNENDALEWSKKASFPVVFKLSCGAGSANVGKINDLKNAEEYIQIMFNNGIFPYTLNEYSRKQKNKRSTLYTKFFNAYRYFFHNDFPPLPSKEHWKPEFGYVYFQEFLPENQFDTRISIIGNRAFGFRRMNRNNDFRASGSGSIDFNPTKIDTRCLQIAFEISKKCSFQSMAYDFLYRKDNPVICEISYGFADTAVHECPGHWDSSLNWINGSMWPEEAQVMDFISQIRLKKNIS